MVAGKPEDYRKYRAYQHSDPREEDPVHKCVVSDLFQHEHIAFTPESEPCREYMSQRCAEQARMGLWDQGCELMSRNQRNLAPDHHSHKEDRIREGVKFTRKTAEKAWCRIVADPNFPESCGTIEKSFDPLVPNSPTYQKRVGAGCHLICDQWDSRSFEMNPLMEKVLSEPEAHRDLLHRVCQEATASGKDLGDTPLEKWCHGMYGYQRPTTHVLANGKYQRIGTSQNSSSSDDGNGWSILFIFGIVLTVVAGYFLSRRRR